MNTLGFEKKPFIFIINFGMDQAIICPVDEADPEKIQFDINGLQNASCDREIKKKFYFGKQPIPYEIYRQRFDKVMQEISYGNTYLLNLTCPTGIQTDLTLHEIFYRSDAKYKLWLRDEFVVFSPETFVNINNGVISSFPMKGTIDASIPDASKVLLSDPKELAEHYTIVDLIRNDLNRVAKQVKVKRFRYVEQVSTNFGSLLQVSSEIAGKLPKDYLGQIGDIIFSLLPAGSITGAPKEKTVQIIRDVEAYDRGFYTGIFGMFDGLNLDSAVMIRFIESTAAGLVFKSGGGITSFSKPEQEYQEMIDKVYVPIT